MRREETKRNNKTGFAFSKREKIYVNPSPLYKSKMNIHEKNWERGKGVTQFPVRLFSLQVLYLIKNDFLFFISRVQLIFY